MPNDSDPLTVHAEITFVWEVEPIRRGGDSRPTDSIRLDGIASTQIRILKGTPEDPKRSEIAMWRMEIGDSAAPGAVFHTQVLGRDTDSVFPKGLDIPRLPGVLVSPFACMEFALGELFQDKWAHIAMKDSGANQRWRSIQAQRHLRHLEWIKEVVNTSSGSPWIMWKMAKPKEELFVTT